MSQDASQTGTHVALDLESMGFVESMEMLRRARTSFSDMCRVVTEESGIRTVPSFSPDQADWCGSNESESDWSIRAGFGGCAPARVVGTYDELCREWLRGPESFHDWIGAMVIDAAKTVVDGDEAGHHDPLVDEPECLPDPAAKSVAEAKIGLMACGYVISPAPIPDYMGTCSFVAWSGDTLTFVAVTDDHDVPERSAALACDVRAWRQESKSTKDDIRAIVVDINDGRLSVTDAEL